MLSTQPKEEAGWGLLDFPAPLSHMENTSVAYRELTQSEGRGAICMSLCEGHALAWGSLESAVSFKLHPPWSATQVSCSLLIFKKSC